MFWPRGECLAYNLTTFPKLLIRFFDFFHSASNMTWIASSFNCKYPLMCVHTSHRPYGYPPLTLCSCQRAHMNSWCNSLHLCCHYEGCWLPCGARTTTCTSFKHIQLLLSMNQHCAPQRWHLHLSWRCHCRPNMWTNLFPRSCATQGFATFDAVQAKNGAIVTNQFFPLVMKVFGCLHK